MVNRITLDCARLTERRSAHDYLAESLSFPGCYGKNLDALCDCLGDLGPTEIALERPELLRKEGGYAEKILNVILKAAEENPYLTVILQERPAERERAL